MCRDVWVRDDTVQISPILIQWEALIVNFDLESGVVGAKENELFLVNFLDRPKPLRAVKLARYFILGPSGLGLGNTFSNISSAWDVLYPENPRLITSRRREQSVPHEQRGTTPD